MDFSAYEHWHEQQGQEMYLKVTKATHTDPEDRELIEEPGEGAAAFIEAMVDCQVRLEVLHVIDDYSDEMLELQVSDYFSPDLEDLDWGNVTAEDLESCVL